MKGVSGKIITVVITLVLAVIAIVVLWQILRIKVFGVFSDLLERAAEGVAHAICEKSGLGKIGIC